MKIEALDTRGIPYHITTSKTKKLILKMGHDAILKIRKPIGLPHAVLEKMIEQKIPWIVKNFLSYYAPKRKYHSGEEYLVLGKSYRMIVRVCSEKNVQLIDDDIVISCLHNNPEEVKKQLGCYVEELASFVLTELLYQCYDIMKEYLNVFPELKIKAYKSQWGCCYYKKQLIYLNYRLIHLPIDLIKYVVFHELAHLVVPNHGPKFHEFVQKFCPNERDCKKRMRQYNPKYE